MNLKAYRPRHYCIRYLLGYLALFIMVTLTRTRVYGRQNIPKTGPFIIACNHFSIIDPVFVICAIGRPINFLMAIDQDIQRYLLWAPWLYGFIPTNRTKLAPSTIKRALGVLKTGEILGIFPEGNTTSKKLRPAKNGVVYLSTVTAVPILPVSVIGLDQVWSLLFRGVRPCVTVKIGEPFGPFKLPLDRKQKGTALKAIGDEVMRRIAVLLPNSNRGVYVNDKQVDIYC